MPIDTIADLAEEWLQSVEYRGATEGTLYLYRYSIKLLMEFLELQGVSEPRQLLPRHMERLGFQLRQRVKPQTANSYLRTIGYFLNWLKQEGYRVPAAGFKRPQIVAQEIMPLDTEQMEAMIRAAGSERNKLMLEILTKTGIRATELCKLRVTDLERHGGRYFLLIQGKGARERLVPVGPTLFRRLRAWRDQDRPDCSSDRLFLSQRKDWRRADYAPLTRSGLLQVVKKAAARAGIEERAYTHLLRHSFTTEGLVQGVGDFQMTQILGHSDGRMLQKHYAHINAHHAYDALMRAMNKPRKSSS